MAPRSRRCRCSAIRVTVLPRPMSSAGAEAEGGHLGQPGESVPLVRRAASPWSAAGGCDQARGSRRRQRPLADLEQAGADDHLLVDVGGLRRLPVRAPAATASAGLTVRTSRLRALRAMAGSTTVQLPRSRSSGVAGLGERVLVSSAVTAARRAPAICQLKADSADRCRAAGSFRGSSRRPPEDGAARSSTVVAVRSRPRRRGHQHVDAPTALAARRRHSRRGG